MGSPTFDVSTVITTLNAIPLADIGVVMLSLAAVAVGFKWTKAMIFG